ncbi:glycosyltransferase [Alicyclobacillus vulcanalis]|uniref:Glycosyltransferase involved in cell wall bisynthesis n=1 Tax=Alicyclobacillus vulcanalis TaxID=252246 RepID=A0A1N7NYP2_9BACL|nr:glycosyltransferase [Alicyclobacillus vulcanalis]SIT03408.1 Glycosyltransferase involved in cell wall bisynthesis [Alicyclobacillus vulcanalis]
MPTEKPNVTVISYHAPPVLNAESILVWKTLQVLRSSFSLRLVTANVASADNTLELPSDIEVRRLPTWLPAAYKPRRAVEKVLGRFVDEAWLWERRAPGAPDAPVDLIYSRSQPGASHLLALRWKLATGKPWIAQFSDPWAHNPYHVGRTARRKAFDEAHERAVVAKADALVFPTREILEQYEQLYPQSSVAKKSIILPHHFMPELYPAHVARPAEAADKLLFAYLGDFYGQRSPEPFLAGLARALAARPDMRQRVAVEFYGNVESKFEPLVAQSPVPIRKGRVSYLESLARMRRADVLLLIDAPSPTGRNPFLASKLIDYLGAGRKILGITDVEGTAADVLRAEGHPVVSPRDVDGIASAIVALMDAFERGESFSVPVPMAYSSEQVVGELAAHMERLLGETRMK